MKKVLVLGATGSIGTSALSVIRDHPDQFRVVGLAACRGSDELATLCVEFPDADVSVHDQNCRDSFLAKVGKSGKRRLLFGHDAGVQLTESVDADVCIAAVSGTAGLAMAFAAARRGMRILLAEKEVMVSAGRLFLETAKKGNAEILPLDSEHSALFQCLDGRPADQVEKLIITASGGPFRTWSPEATARATPAEALRHPVWKMGAKITIDSATLANKALEVIEAHHLFGFPFERLEVVVHPESIIHGMIELTDGSLLSHMGLADMRCCASFGLFYPKREKCATRRLNLPQIRQMTFEHPDTVRFPLLNLGISAGKRGENSSAAFNAANEAAVELFLEKRIGFSDISVVVDTILSGWEEKKFTSLEEVEETHRVARASVIRWAEKQGR